MSDVCNTYSLYIKVHKITGLRYLGQTSGDPFTYPGSGKDWKKHLKEFGRYLDTHLLLQTTEWEELTHWGRFYSDFYHVVNAVDDFGNKIWANKIPESGGGGGMTSAKAKSIQCRTELRLLSSQQMTDRMRDKEFKNKVVTALTSPESKEKSKEERKKPEVRKKWLDALSAVMKSEDYKDKVRGSKHHRYDHTLYEFTHITGYTENLTKQEMAKKYNLCTGKLLNLINGDRGIHKGWTYGPYNKHRR